MAQEESGGGRAKGPMNIEMQIHFFLCHRRSLLFLVFFSVIYFDHLWN